MVLLQWSVRAQARVRNERLTIFAPQILLIYQHNDKKSDLSLISAYFVFRILGCSRSSVFAHGSTVW
jgi:hypothetical protein